MERFGKLTTGAVPAEMLVNAQIKSRVPVVLWVLFQGSLCFGRFGEGAIYGSAQPLRIHVHTLERSEIEMNMDYKPGGTDTRSLAAVDKPKQGNQYQPIRK